MKLGSVELKVEVETSTIVHKVRVLRSSYEDFWPSKNFDASYEVLPSKLMRSCFLSLRGPTLKFQSRLALPFNSA
jgi:hypothetical protein